MDKAQFHTVISKLGNDPKKNSAKENMMVGDAYRKSNRLAEATPFYQAVIKEGISDEAANVYLAQSLKVGQKYEEAIKILTNYLKRGRDKKVKKTAERELENLNKLKHIVEDNYYTVKNLQDINTIHAEYSPVYVRKNLFFTSNREVSKIYKTTGTPFTDIYRVASKGANVDLTTLISLDPVINHIDTNEGSVAISSNGNRIIFAKGNNGKTLGYSEVNLFYTRYRNGKWTEPIPLSINIAEAWDSTPAFSPDGKTLYFSSTRSGGYGGADLYQAKINRRGRWVDVRNLGPEINTPNDEMFPYVSMDGSLYFSSNGHPGYGKLDMFKAVRESGHITINNLGKPMNSSADDFGLFQYNLTKGFFSSNRRGGKGDDDIYTFVNNDPDLKVVNYFLKGVTLTTDDAGREIILATTKILFTADDGSVLDEAFTGADGTFEFRVYPEEHYDLVSEKIDYFTVRKGFTTIGKTVDKTKLTEFVTNVYFETKIVMDPIVLEKTIVLNNIYYDLDKATIRSDATPILDSLVQIMTDNPDIYIELGSHTDSRQTAEYNLELSKKRAEAAVNYIIKNGVKSERIRARGYGKTKLLIKNAQTEEQHQKNRRTEFKVLRYNPKNRDDEDEQLEEPEDEYDRFFNSSSKGDG